MELPDNILKYYLKNVYFISGSACGGKSTIARRLSIKHGIELYNWDERFAQHKAISDPIHQPYMNKTWESWEAYFSRPPSDQSVTHSILEQVKIAIVELLTLSQGRPIIVEGIFPCDILDRISSKNRVVFLMAEMQAIRADFFSRADKQDMLRCIETLENPEQAKENVFRSIEYALNRDIENVKNSGFWYHVRGVNPDWEWLVQAIEHQFELISRKEREYGF